MILIKLGFFFGHERTVFVPIKFEFHGYLRKPKLLTQRGVPLIMSAQTNILLKLNIYDQKSPKYQTPGYCFFSLLVGLLVIVLLLCSAPTSQNS